MDPINHTCVTCCDDTDVAPCCECNAKRDACATKKIAEEERSTRKRSSWNNESMIQRSSSATFFILSFVFVAALAGVVAWRRCRRHDGKRRFRFREGRTRRQRVPKSPPNTLRTFETSYEKLPLSETGGQQLVDDDNSSSSDDEYYFRPSLNGESTLRDERRRLVSTNETNSSTIDIWLTISHGKYV